MATERSKKTAGGAGPVWERAARPTRPQPAPLSRESIVAAAITLADASGLGGLSLRKVGAELAAGPMRLYGYVETKEELLELMVDEVWGEVCGALRGSWREVLGESAQRIRAASRKHPWFVGLLGGRPQFGPNALAYRETVFAALSETPGFESIDFVLACFRTLTAYVIGALHSEDAALRQVHESGLADSDWQMAMWPYLQRTLATGRYPLLAKVVRDAKHPSADESFARGLAIVLDGIAAQLTR